ncbi:MAG TPA: UGSC family (seleno)protein, partial [Burkholderiales bacterium]|nr:UGSC family (seleno)protein [Burkholderiales bacterium]
MQKLTLLNPRMAEDVVHAALAPQLAALRNARIAFVDNSKVNADLFLSRVKPLLEEKYGVLAGKTLRKLAPKDELTEADLNELAGYDAVIQCFGDCGTSTSMTVADGVRLERLGIPTATVISTAFSRAARLQARGRGMGQLPIVEIPHPMHTASKPAVSERAEGVIMALAAALTQRGDAVVPVEEPQLPAELLLDDAPESVQEFFFAQGWTDGLPVMPPTHAAVRAMLAAVGRDAQETIGPIPPRMRMATLEKIAINAVMAGCRPEYFPVVLAAVDAVLDPECRLYGIRTATNNGTPLIIVNGPIVDKLGLNSKGNVFGQGWRANATIGRALQLVLRNIGGDLPGETDMSTQGQP